MSSLVVVDPDSSVDSSFSIFEVLEDCINVEFGFKDTVYTLRYGILVAVRFVGHT